MRYNQAPNLSWSQQVSHARYALIYDSCAISSANCESPQQRATRKRLNALCVLFIWFMNSSRSIGLFLVFVGELLAGYEVYYR